MECPVCRNVDLALSDRQGIEIDYCPQCRGVWLDRGELDKLIERSSTPIQNNNPFLQNQSRHYPKKKKGFLDELFDFD